MERVGSRVVLVTGAGRRLGRALAEGLAAAGHDLILFANRSREGAEAVAAAARSEGRRAAVVAADLSDRGDSARAFGEASALAGSWGGLDGVVHAAASYERLSLHATSDDDWDRILETNLTAAFRLLRATTPLLCASPARGGGSAILLAETSFFIPMPSHFAHTVAKGALIPLARTFAKALAPKARVNVLALGPVLPPADLPEDEREAAFERIPMGDPGGPAEVLRAVAWLLDSERITGEVIRIDGGRGLR